MMVRRLITALLGLLVVWAQPAAAMLVDQTFVSAHVGEAKVSIWLPSGYEMGNRRYPVIYMHDGQNLFDPAVSAFKKVWAVDRAVEALAAAGAAEPAIIVGIWSPGAMRTRQYMPAAVYARLSDPLKLVLAGRLDDAPTSDAYLRFIVEELKPAIDATYRTRPDRASTSIMGSSMGGLISLYAIAEYPDVFGQAGCVSSHWPIFLVAPGTSDLHRSEVMAAWTGYLAERLGPPAGRRIWFDHGTRELDAAYAPYQQAVDAQLAQMGWVAGRDMISRVYSGTGHNEESWARRLGDPLAFLLAGPPVEPQQVAAPSK